MPATAAHPSVRPPTTPPRRLIAPAVLALLAILALAGCGGSGKHSQNSSAGGSADLAGTVKARPPPRRSSSRKPRGPVRPAGRPSRYSSAR